MSYVRVFNLIAVTCVLSLAGCTSIGNQAVSQVSDPVSCNSIVPNALVDAVASAEAVEDPLKWIETELHAGRDMVTVLNDSTAEENIAYYRWTTPEGDYRLDVSDGVLRSAFYSWGDDEPSLERFVECIGDPDGYFAWINPEFGDLGEYISLIYFYSHKGMLVRKSMPWVLNDGANTDDMRVPRDVTGSETGGLFITDAKDLPSLLANYLSYGLNLDVEGSDKNVLSWYRSQVRTWPGSFDLLTYNRLPSP